MLGDGGLSLVSGLLFCHNMRTKLDLDPEDKALMLAARESDWKLEEFYEIVVKILENFSCI